MYVDVEIKFSIDVLLFFIPSNTVFFKSHTEWFIFSLFYVISTVTFNFNTYTNMPLILTPNIAIRILHVEDNA